MGLVYDMIGGSYRGPWAIGVLFLSAVSALAGDAGRFIPAHCTPYLTVQSSECEVDHYYTCAGEPDGHQWRLSFDRTGPIGLFQVDYEYRWLQSEFYRSNITDVLVEPEQNPASMTELLETGRDDIRFMLEFTFADGGTVRERFEGYDRLTGETQVIDGETLLVTEYSMTHMSESGAFYSRSSGNEYVHPEYRLFLSYRETYEQDDGTVTQFFNAPVKFLEPGEPGFLNDTPQYGCEAMMSALPATGDRG